MSRLPALTYEELTPEQRRVRDGIAATRFGSAGGPFAAWLRIPKLAELAGRFGDELRTGILDRKLFEIAVLAIAHFWSAEYEWYIHESTARLAGVSANAIEAIRLGQTPAFETASEATVYRFVSELQTTHTTSDETYEAVLQCLGQEALIELVTDIGFYTTAAMLINVFQTPVPDGRKFIEPS